MKYLDNVTAYHRVVNRLRVHIFLAGLDTKFEQICGEILCKDPIPEFEVCYALIYKEATRHATIQGETSDMDASVMIARQQQKSNQVDKTHLSVVIATRLVTRKLDVLKLWDIHNGGIIPMNLGRRTTKSYP